MELEIVSVENDTDIPEKERVEISVKKTTNLMGYAIVDNTYDEQVGLSNTYRHFYKFPNWAVKYNDIVYLYTGVGENIREDYTIGGFEIHHLYCGRDSVIWNKDGDVARLLKISETHTFIVPPVKSILKK
jgi:hypothetical protein